MKSKKIIALAKGVWAFCSYLFWMQGDTFQNERFRVWQNGSAGVLLPAPDNDLILVFSHILQHFFRGGIGLRQICDWCRLLWTYRSEIDLALVEARLRKMGVMTEWMSFASLAVEFLGMPMEAMPLYSCSSCWTRKARRILAFVLETGNFGHNRDMSYMKRKPYFVRKAISLWRHTWDFMRRFFIFPMDSVRVWLRMIARSAKAVM